MDLQLKYSVKCFFCLTLLCSFIVKYWICLFLLDLLKGLFNVLGKPLVIWLKGSC